MTPADLALARELAAHPRWAWRAGMRASGMGYGSRTLSGTHWIRTTERLAAPGMPHLDHAVPDLTDDATAGVLLGMLTEAAGWNSESPYRAGGAWSIFVDGSDGREGYRGSTLAVAAARALLAVWGPA